ncbi:HNH endonuclease signature motif containing protein [Rhodobacteraceae bacterium nBUS_22]
MLKNQVSIDLNFPFKILKDEIWKPVPSVNGLWVSSLQRVWAGCYAALNTKGKNQRHITIKTSNFISPYPQKGYLAISFQNKSYRVHALICEAFHGVRPSETYIANHLNAVRTDNSPYNLEWETPRGNSRHSVTLRKKLGEDFGRDYPDEVVSKVLQMTLDNYSYAEITRQTGIRAGTISLWVRGHSRDNKLSHQALENAEAKRSGKLSNLQVEEISKLLISGKNFSEISEILGIKKGTISALINNRNRKNTDNSFLFKARSYWRTLEKKSGNKGEKNYSSKLMEAEVAEIKWYLSRGYSGSQLAEIYQVFSGTISKIKAGRTWGSVKAKKPNKIVKNRGKRKRASVKRDFIKSKGNEIEIETICSEVLKGKSLSSIAKLLDCERSTLGYLISGKTFADLELQALHDARVYFKEKNSSANVEERNGCD